MPKLSIHYIRHISCPIRKNLLAFLHFLDYRESDNGIANYRGRVRSWPRRCCALSRLSRSRLRSGLQRSARWTSTRSMRIHAAKAAEQASRCSQCGVPFCQVHCPLSNNIPDWLKLTAEGRLEEAYELSQATNNMPGDLRPHLPAGSPLRRQLRHRAIRPRHRDHRRDREISHRHRLGERLGAAAEAGRERGQSIGIIGAGPAGLAAAEQLAPQGLHRSRSTTATTARADC